MTPTKPSSSVPLTRARLRLRRRPLPPSEREVARSFDRLRHLLVGSERTRIDTLEARPPVAAESVATVLPDAVVRATADGGEEMFVALEPTVTRAVTAVARRQPELYGEILAPTIGVAVRKAVAEAIAAMLERFNQALEQSCSVESIRWRIEAARTGQTFAEVVLLRTLKYRVEQVMLIHTPTSLVLQHVVDPALQPEPPDQIAAMLSAIDTFGREAFGPMPEEAYLRKFEMGDLVVWLTRSAELTLVAVVRGDAAAEIGARLTETLTRVRLASQPALDAFESDVAPFATVRPLLEPLLEMVRSPPKKRAQGLLLFVAAALAVFLTARVAWTTSRRAIAEERHRGFVAALASEPGYVVTNTTWSEDHAHVSGLRDPMAEPPETIAARNGMSGATFELAPFVSLDAPIVRRRIERALDAPPTVTWTYEDGVLRVAGVAPRAWAEGARHLGRALPGVVKYDDGALRSAESLDALRVAVASIETATIVFRRDEREPTDQRATLERVADAARAAVAATEGAHASVCLEITGYADQSGAESYNLSLSASRASAAADRLVALGIDRAMLLPHGAGSTPGADARRVRFRLDVDEARTGAGCRGAGP